MSSDYQEGTDISTSSPPRRRSSTPESPRKRRRVGSPDHTQRRKHHLLRKRRVEIHYNNEYRLLFNEHVAHAASRFHVDDLVQYYTNQVGSVLWSPAEQATFFAALARLGKDDLPGIARAIATKTETEARDFLILLQNSASNQGDAKVTLRDISAAIEIGGPCSSQLDEAADALAWYQERLEAAQEQERHGKYWLITPLICEKIEDAVNGIAQPTPGSHTPTRDFKKFGSGVAGACAHCKKRKIKCDRKMPCTSCVKSKADCVYPKNPPVSTETSFTLPKGCGGGDATVKREPTEPPILEAIPEAKLLDPGMMLAFSKGIFMNRSSDLPSPWPHWSTYTSELAAEPAMYRTAFSDFHRLVVSVTKRLVQSAIIQATSRLRAQRLRKDKGLLPLVKVRDAHSAIDVLGMARDGSERWRGVPRRCGLKVLDSETTSTGRRTREMSWSEVERVLSITTTPKERSASEAAISVEPDDFRSRATRSGTPLPMHSLTLSDSERGIERTNTTDDEEDESIEGLEHFAGDKPPTGRHAWQPRNVAGRYASVPLESMGEGPLHGLATLETFDQEASRQEEAALWSMLDMQPTEKDESDKVKVRLDNDPEPDERVTTAPDDWRQLLEYKMPWETFRRPVIAASMLANRKPPSPILAPYGAHAVRTDSTPDNLSNASSSEQPRRQRARSRSEVELRARGTHAYAALQRDELEPSDNHPESSSSEAESDLMEQDIPANSIEAGHDTEEIYESVSEMEWALGYE
ncbi:hypothetical protein BDU57DRAFT_503348 [Ampelomyces quisqualis]|uniref:Zn(2)-C6 fungal-type domain-containing protein n=1 Tax=Ampelomyces quisqualis TaxID=50730 RepID=A0A6A5QAZ9_AMPQU|nr:hypothetical protein BDU57DRAFT_503348 [Ampelomyces quisqualis]